MCSSWSVMILLKINKREPGMGVISPKFMEYVFLLLFFSKRLIPPYTIIPRTVSAKDNGYNGYKLGDKEAFSLHRLIVICSKTQSFWFCYQLSSSCWVCYCPQFTIKTHFLQDNWILPFLTRWEDYYSICYQAISYFLLIKISLGLYLLMFLIIMFQDTCIFFQLPSLFSWFTSYSSSFDLK